MIDTRAFRSFRFPAEIILWAVRWYLQFRLCFTASQVFLLSDHGLKVIEQLTGPDKRGNSGLNGGDHDRFDSVSRAIVIIRAIRRAGGHFRGPQEGGSTGGRSPSSFYRQ